MTTTCSSLRRSVRDISKLDPLVGFLVPLGSRETVSMGLISRHFSAVYLLTGLRRSVCTAAWIITLLIFEYVGGFIRMGSGVGWGLSFVQIILIVNAIRCDEVFVRMLFVRICC